MSDAAVNGVPTSSIYIGFWINWSHGYLRGATVTLTKRDGGLLTAFLALFMTIVARSFWRLFCFLAHIYLSYSTAQDGLYHQTQATLRNADESMVGLKSLTQIAWNWRKGSKRLAYSKALSLIGVTILITAGFYVASIFSSQISAPSANEVLISTSTCGMAWNNTKLDESAPIKINSYLTKLITSSASYAQQCYGDNTTTTAVQECSIFVKRQLMPSAVSRNTGCPFPGGNKICLRESANLRIDSGLLSSHTSFGINTAPSDRFSFRNVIECAPLRTSEYRRLVRAPDNSSIDSTIEYLYGKSKSHSTVNPLGSFWRPSLRQQYSDDYEIENVASFDTWVPGGHLGTFDPIPELRRDDARISLFYLMADSVSFLQPVDDDLFAAHMSKPEQMKFMRTYEYNENEVYLFDSTVHVLGCATQNQFCLINSNCTPLTSFGLAFDTVSKTITNRQKLLIRAFISAQTYLDDVVSGLGRSSLLARNSLAHGSQGPLPSDQWQLEVEHWNNIAMANVQRMIIEWATGPSDRLVADLVQTLPDDASRQVCKDQKVKTTSHTSFSVLELCIVLILGLAIIVLEFSIEPLARCIRRRSSSYRRLEWVTNETLQLQRMAHEELGAGTWIRAAENVPTTTRSEGLATLDVSDPVHPRLVYPRKSEGQLNESHEQDSSSAQTTYADTTGTLNEPEDSGGNSNSLDARCDQDNVLSQLQMSPSKPVRIESINQPSAAHVAPRTSWPLPRTF